MLCLALFFPRSDHRDRNSEPLLASLDDDQHRGESDRLEPSDSTIQRALVSMIGISTGTP